jgi:hypothetical protein
MTDIDRRLLLGLAGVAGATLAAKLAQGGSLNPPPGPIVPTGKTTDQIEPRIDLINAPASANVTSDVNSHYIINNPGSYYLSANLAVSKTNGISVLSNDVTLDLCGFAIRRTGGSGGYGFLSVTNTEVTIRNGTARGFQTGFNLGERSRVADISAAACTSGIIMGGASVATGCVAENCPSAGFYGDEGSVFSDCAAHSCGRGFYTNNAATLTRCTAGFTTDTAFFVHAGSTLHGCTAFGGTNTVVFELGDGSSVTGCTAYNNVAAYAFSAGPGCVLQGCTAESNNSSSAAGSAGFSLLRATARGCVANNNTTSVGASSQNGSGFVAAGTGNVLEGCVAQNNTGAGFHVDTRCVVARCEAIDNGFSGIDVTGSDNVIEANRLVSNSGNGVLVEATLNLVFANCARGNTAGNYSIVAGNRVGTIVVPSVTASAITGNVGGTAFTTDPYANIAF